MKHLKITLVLIPLFILSCASPSLYLKDYEPINVFLETQKLDKNKKYILQSDKADNKEALRLFNGCEGIEHIIDSTDLTDYTDSLFIEKHWKKLYKKYAQDTLKRYWKKEDFPGYDFVLENREGFLGAAFTEKYLNTRTNIMIIISEPMYYMNKKYIMSYFNMFPFFGSSRPEVVIMKKEKEKWVVVRTIGDYVYY